MILGDVQIKHITKMRVEIMNFVEMNPFGMCVCVFVWGEGGRTKPQKT